MTVFIADIASYQNGLTAGEVLGAGFTAVNVKLSHGLTQKSVHPDAVRWLADERFQISTFHWLDASASGAQQASYAYTRMVESMSAKRMRECAHVVDCESNATELQWRDYCATMSTLLKRPIATYSGDWWWAGRVHAWSASPFSPWLWAAPNDGYLGGYPGDESDHWVAGYGQWGKLAVMQYAVLSIAGTKVSMSAVRSMEVWDAMRGVSMAAWKNIPASVSLLDEFNEAFPLRSKATDGTKGDDAHAQRPSDHNPDETGKTPYEDKDSINEVHARDIGDRLNKAGWSMERVITGVLLPRLRSGKEKRLQNIIHHGKVISDTWDWSEWRPASGHETWAHFGFKYGSGSGTTNVENITTPWGILAAIAEEEKPAMTTPSDAQLKSAATAGTLGYAGGGLPQGIAGGNFLNYFTEQYNRLKADESEDDAQMLWISEALVNAQGMLAALSAEPSEDHPIVKAVRFAMDNPPAEDATA